MNKREIYKALYNDEKVRHLTMPLGVWISLDYSGCVYFSGGQFFDFREYPFDGWVIYKPTRKVKKVLKVYQDTEGVIRVMKGQSCPVGEMEIKIEVKEED